MSRICEITGKKPAVANNVSHANNRTKRRQLPNLQERSLYSSILDRNVQLRLSTNAIRTIDKYDGIDGFMLNVKNRNTETFSTNAKKIRKVILKRAEAQEAASA